MQPSASIKNSTDSALIRVLWKRPARATHCSKDAAKFGKNSAARDAVVQAVYTPPAPTGSLINSDLPSVDELESAFLDSARPLRVLIAGGGIAGLVLAVALLKKGVQVRIFEQDMTAIRGEGKYRGPIQVQSNALAALEAIDAEMAAEIMDSGCVTGDRINGLCDGVSGDWYCKFDTYHPAVENGLPITRVISRVTLQQILAKYAERMGGENVIIPDSKVQGFTEDSVNGHRRVWAELESGERDWGDLLIGADGIWSKVRKQMIGETPPCYSGYTCYTGISDFVCHDIDTVAYRVFLGSSQYFVSSDVGGGKMQWYAFHEEPAGGHDTENAKKERLLEIFGSWNDMVTDLIAATPEEDVLRRDIFDRPPIFQWTKGRVALLGDSAHAMQPNLGQGGCMAIEDAYELGKIIDELMSAARPKAQASGQSEALHLNYDKVLGRYQRERMMRASAIHGMARMAAIAASTYKAYLGEQFNLQEKIKILHPGRVMGKLVLGISMPMVLGWVLGGNTGKLKVADRAQYCSLEDQPRGFAQADWDKLLSDDEALLTASHATWVLFPEHPELASEPQEQKAIMLENKMTIGSGNGADIQLLVPCVAEKHATLDVEDEHYYVRNACNSHSTFLNGDKLQTGKRYQMHPGDIISLGGIKAEHPTLKVKLLHKSQVQEGLLCKTSSGKYARIPVVSASSAVI